MGILRCLDKLDKIGCDKVIEEMVDKVGITAAQAGKVLEMAQLQGTPTEIMSALEDVLSGSETGETGLTNLRELFDTVRACGLPDGRVSLDVSIARGLDYYTGTIYETFLEDLPGIGSVCSGGRYDNLAEKFTSQKLPGVGASLGLDRMLAAMEELGMTQQSTTPAPVLVTMFERERASDYLQMAQTLRRAGIGTEVFPDAKGLGKQMKYADKKGFKVALIAGADEFAAGTWQVKGLRDGSQHQAETADVVEVIRAIIEA